MIMELVKSTKESNNSSTYSNKIFLTKKMKKIRNWTKDEDEILLKYAEINGFKIWKKVAENLMGRSPSQCSSRYKLIRPGVLKGQWSIEEDKKILKLISEYGLNWSLLGKKMPSRTGKQIRDRYLNTLDPNINREKFSEDEDKRIIELFNHHGTCWSKISKFFVGRTPDMIKNRFYSSLKKKINEYEFKKKTQRLINHLDFKVVNECLMTKETSSKSLHTNKIVDDNIIQNFNPNSLLESNLNSTQYLKKNMNNAISPQFESLDKLKMKKIDKDFNQQEFLDELDLEVRELLCKKTTECQKKEQGNIYAKLKSEIMEIMGLFQ